MSLLLFAEGSFSAPATDDSSHIASSGSTPPTTVADSASLHSDTSRHEVITVADDVLAPAISVVTAADVPSPRRARRARASSPVYNLSRLSGTSAHGRRRSKGDAVANRKRRTISGDSLFRSIEGGADGPRDAADPVHASIDALNIRCRPEKPTSPRSPRSSRPSRGSPRHLRFSSRLSGPAIAVAPLTSVSLSTSISSSTATATASGKNRRSSGPVETALSRELRRLQDTKEFAHIDDMPVIHTVWSNGKFLDPNQTAPAGPPARIKSKTKTKTKTKTETETRATPDTDVKAEDDDAPEPITRIKPRTAKKYLNRGLYSGQEYPTDITRCLSALEKKELAHLPELQPSGEVNPSMPPPMFTGLRLLLKGRDFKLPWNICNPLPPGQPKPDEWKKMTKNRFIGGSKEIWRKLPHIHDYQSKCVCLPNDGCGESCQNRIMLYECDETNCNVGKAHCTNRAFADLMARRTKGGKYRVGVEVIKTADRGYGVRSNRCFEPHQIIMEYTGEIITEEECERRMKEIYKDNECYYLMSFDQNMIIDATTGSIARFVNHSCNPNCRMIKWIVSGQPRMALFAGDKPIMTGDELTYDYNFDPFSAKNVQKCLCGQPNCRGVLGPRPREPKGPKAVKASSVKAGKRKLEDLVADGEDEAGKKTAKKAKTAQQGASKSISVASIKVAKSATTAVKKGVSVKTMKNDTKSKSKSKKTNTNTTKKDTKSINIKTNTNKKKKTTTTTTPRTKKKTTTSVARVTATIRAGKNSLSKTTASAKRIIQTYGSGSRPTKTGSSIIARSDGRIKIVKKATPTKKESSKGDKALSPSKPSKLETSKAFEVD